MGPLAQGHRLRHRPRADAPRLDGGRHCRHGLLRHGARVAGSPRRDWPSPRIVERPSFDRISRQDDPWRDRPQVSDAVLESSLAPADGRLGGGRLVPLRHRRQGPRIPGRPARGRRPLADLRLARPWPQRLEILGAPVVELDLAVDRRRRSSPSGSATWRRTALRPGSSYGILNLSHRDGHDQPRRSTPGERYPRPRAAQRCRLCASQPGHRSAAGALDHLLADGLALAGAGHAHGPPGGARRLDAARPPERASDKDAAGLAEPEQGPPSRRVALREGAWENWVRKDTDSGRVTVGAKRDDGLARVESSGIEFGSVMSEEIGLTEGDPLQRPPG